MCCTLTKSDVGRKYFLKEIVCARSMPQHPCYLISFDEKNGMAGFAEWPDWKPRIFLKKEEIGDKTEWRRVIKIKRSWTIYPGSISEDGRYSYVEVEPFKPHSKQSP